MTVVVFDLKDDKMIKDELNKLVMALDGVKKPPRLRPKTEGGAREMENQSPTGMEAALSMLAISLTAQAKSTERSAQGPPSSKQPGIETKSSKRSSGL